MTGLLNPQTLAAEPWLVVGRDQNRQRCFRALVAYYPPKNRLDSAPALVAVRMRYNKTKRELLKRASVDWSQFRTPI